MQHVSTILHINGNTALCLNSASTCMQYEIILLLMALAACSACRYWCLWCGQSAYSYEASWTSKLHFISASPRGCIYP